MILKEKSFWSLFIFGVIVILFYLVGGLVGIEFAKSLLIWFLVLLIPALVTLLHSIWMLAGWRWLFFIILAGLVGFLAEFIGLNYGTVFGGYYIYHPRALMLMGVPLTVIVYWAVFTYLGYSIVNSFLHWRDKDKPNKAKNNFLLIPLLCLFDGLIVTAIDLFMDPIQVAEGNWTWVGGGPYFGVPIGNFVGWFAVMVIITGIFRTFEYFYPKKPAVPKSIFLLPVLAYTVIWFSFLFSALETQMLNLALVGTLVMLPTILISLFTYKTYTKK